MHSADWYHRKAAACAAMASHATNSEQRGRLERRAHEWVAEAKRAEWLARLYSEKSPPASPQREPARGDSPDRNG